MKLNISSIKKPKIPIKQQRLNNPTVLRYSTDSGHSHKNNDYSYLSDKSVKKKLFYEEEDHQILKTPAKCFLNQSDFINTASTYKHQKRFSMENKIQIEKIMSTQNYSTQKQRQSKNIIKQSGFLRFKKLKKAKVPINQLAQYQHIIQNDMLSQQSSFISNKRQFFTFQNI